MRRFGGSILPRKTSHPDSSHPRLRQLKHRSAEGRAGLRQKCRRMAVPQPNSPPDDVFRTNQLPNKATLNQQLARCELQSHRTSNITLRVVVVVFQDHPSSPLCYTRTPVLSQVRSSVRTCEKACDLGKADHLLGHRLKPDRGKTRKVTWAWVKNSW